MRRETPGRAFRLVPVLLAALAAFSVYLSSTRIYQVDECENVAMARVLAEGEQARFLARGDLLAAALSRLERGPVRARVLFARARAAMLAVFWLNLILLAACTGEDLRTRRGWAALLAAATLAPLWDYGFEVRHDNPALTGLLLSWYVLRARPAGRRSYAAAGFLAAVLPFVAFKALAYVLPLSAVFLAWPPPEHRAPRRALAAAWAAGAAAGLASVRLGYGALGLWPAEEAALRWMAGLTAGGAPRFLPGETLARLLAQTPLLLALLAAALVDARRELARREGAARLWAGDVPETALFAGALLLLFANPVPYPYDLLLLVPFGFLAAWRRAVRLADGLLRERRELVPLAGALVLFAHFGPFAAATARHVFWSDARQVRLMDAAEDLTGPADPVYDGIGLVPTRPFAAYDWLLHSVNIRSFTNGPGPRVRDQLARDPAPVLIPSYRTDWLGSRDQAFFARRYVALSDDFRVLGAVLPPGGGRFDVLRAGRYRLSPLSDSGLGGTVPAADPSCVPARLDGARVAAGATALSAGTHRLRAPAGCLWAAVWVGPRLERPPFVGWGDRRRLFVNWY
ncbi:MAG: hypothetical protein KGM24_02050 [Elusimicrobia bacterium]|nr:hypothetical protein [Elusimicrobiota bacterium]